MLKVWLNVSVYVCLLLHRWKNQVCKYIQTYCSCLCYQDSNICLKQGASFHFCFFVCFSTTMTKETFLQPLEVLFYCLFRIKGKFIGSLIRGRKKYGCLNVIIFCTPK